VKVAAGESKLFARAGKVFRIVSLIKHFLDEIGGWRGDVFEKFCMGAELDKSQRRVLLSRLCLRGRKETITVHKSGTTALSSLPLKYMYIVRAF
jgi:hypothetical protein